MTENVSREHELARMFINATEERELKLFNLQFSKLRKMQKEKVLNNLHDYIRGLRARVDSAELMQEQIKEVLSGREQ